jgi:chromosome partitioning protein
MAKIILVTHQKGGVGKSTLTFNMALAIKDEAKVAIIDLDLQGSLWRSRHSVDVPILPSDNLNEIKNLNYDFVFIDTPPYLNEKLPKLIKLADVIVVPTKTGVYDLMAIEDTLNVIKSEKGENKTLIVLNMVKYNSTLTTEMLEAIDRFEIQVAKTHISDLVAFTRSAINNGINDEKAKNQIENLTMEVLQKTQ